MNNFTDNVIDFNEEIMPKKKPEKKKKLPKGGAQIIVLCVCMVFLFGAVIFNFKHFIDVDSTNFIYNRYNSRFGTYSDKVVRGDIKTSDGTVVATTETEDGKESRVYPYKEMFSHVVGYVKQGMDGLEKEHTFELLQTHISYKELYENEMEGKKSPGDSLITTLDFDTQKAAYDAMGFYKGAVVAIEPDTGKIIAMVSKPDFDPNTIDQYWDFITDETVESSILMNRATSGKYPPGSTFKIVTTIAYLRNNKSDAFSFNCKGALKLDDYTIHCSNNKNHGSQNLEQAFAHSCNCAFASIGTSLDKNDFQKTANELLLNAELPTSLTKVKKSTFKVSDSNSEGFIGQSSIGQAQTEVTPLYMAMLTSAIANDGILMKPYLIEGFESADGEMVSENSPEKYGDLCSKEASYLRDYMGAVTEYGTADDVDFGSLKVYGKTGTAEYVSQVKSCHSWFVGFSENNGKKLAVAVIMEGAGYGSEFAAPVASKVLQAYLE